MKFSFCCSSIILTVFAIAGTATATGRKSVRGASAPAVQISDGDESYEEGEGYRGMRFLSKRRRLLPYEGVMRTLIIRVTDSQGKQPITDARMESDVWFGTHDLNYAGNINSMSSLYDQCSGGKLNFVPATGTRVVDGVLELTVSQDLKSVSIATAGGYVRNDFNALNADLGIEFEAYSIILPDGVAGRGGLARLGGNHQMYGGGAERSLELVMHEFGHNFGMHHSGLPNEGEYDDNSCLMGCCAGAQQMCFNAAKSWYSGWYSDPGKEGYEDLTYFDTPGEWWKGKMVGIDDYLNDLYDEDQHRVVARITGGLFVMFNRKKGVNSGVKAYGNDVVIVQQWWSKGTSNVLGTLNEGTNSFTWSDRDIYDFDIVVKLCEVFYAPVVTGPQIFGGTASQSSTAAGAEAGRAIDGNLDQAWAGGSVTHTEGDDDIDPWWEWTLDSPEAVEHVRIYNRGDCCGDRLNNAIVELVDAQGGLLFSQNLGSAVSVRELYLGKVYNDVKQIKIQLLGNKILSLAEVQMFGPLGEPRERLPDHAQVIAFVSDGTTDLGCDTTDAPTLTPSPSSAPTKSFPPTVFKAIPKGVVLMRDDSPCILQVNPDAHPDRFKCMIEATTSSSEPGGYGNDPVTLRGQGGCLIVVQPVTWAWSGTAFIFESSESLEAINACFAQVTLLTEVGPTSSPSAAPSVGVSAVLSTAPSVGATAVPSAVPSMGVTAVPSTAPSVGSTAVPSAAPSVRATAIPSAAPSVGVTAVPSAAPVGVIPSGVVLQRDRTPCIEQVNPSNHPDRFKCMLEPTTPNSEPGTYGNEPIALLGQGGCFLVIQPVTWAWDGTAFIFQSSATLDEINACFAPDVLITKSNPTTVPSAAPSVEIIPRDVVLQRDGTPCIEQINPSNHADRFKCMLEPTTPNSEPGTYDNEPVVLLGQGGCFLVIQPVTWAWGGNAFIFQSSDNLDAINGCFAAGTLITADTIEYPALFP